MSTNTPYQDPKREIAGLTAAVEKKALVWFAARLPEWVMPDHLTALGLLALLVGGLAYVWSNSIPALLFVVNAPSSSTGSATAWTARWRGIDRSSARASATTSTTWSMRLALSSCWVGSFSPASSRQPWQRRFSSPTTCSASTPISPPTSSAASSCPSGPWAAPSCASCWPRSTPWSTAVPSFHAFGRDWLLFDVLVVGRHRRPLHHTPALGGSGHPHALRGRARLAHAMRRYASDLVAPATLAL